MIDELRHEFPLQILLHVSEVKKATYYYHKKNLEKADKYATIKEAIERIFYQHKELYGYRRIVLALRKEGFFINHKTVRRLMNDLGLHGVQKSKKYRSYRGEVGQIANNKINRHFETEKPNQVWLTDVTEFKVAGNKLYLSAFLDVFNREIVGYSITQNPNFGLIQDSFGNAIKRANLSLQDQVLIHSDQGWLYQIPRFQQLIKPYNMSQSMSRKGNCLDNALMEGFFGILKNECIYRNSFRSLEEATQEIETYIEYYNTLRIKQKLNGMSPIEYRLNYEKAA